MLLQLVVCEIAPVPSNIAQADFLGIWRWGFYINLVVGGVFAPAYIWLVPSFDPRPDTATGVRLRSVDWIGTCVFLAGSCCLTLAISFGGIVYSFKSGAMIALWVLSGILLCVMIVVSRRHPGLAREDRLYPAHFLKSPILFNMQVQMFLASGVILVSCSRYPSCCMLCADHHLSR